LDTAYAVNLASEQLAAANGLQSLERLDSRFYGTQLEADAVAVASGIADTRSTSYITFAALSLMFTIIGIVLLRGDRRDERLMTNETAFLAAVARRADFETSLQRGLEMQPTEENAFGVLRQAMTTVAADVATEFLLADSSDARFRQVISTAPDADAECCVESPAECPAATTGQTRFFDDSRRIDTCPYLRDRDDAVWAVCVPVSLAGETNGVLHAQGGIATVPPDALAEDLELVGRKAGERISVLRVLGRSHTQAVFTAGFPGRRTLDAAGARPAAVTAVLERVEDVDDEDERVGGRDARR
jgi:hypothetical protein